MKIIFFTYDFPYPTNSGGKTRAYNLLKYGQEGVDVILFSFVRKDFDKKNIEKINDIGIKNVKLFNRRLVRDPRNILTVFDPRASIFKYLYFRKDVLEELGKTIINENIELIHFESFYTFFYIKELLKETDVKLVCAEENIEYKIYDDYSKNLSSKMLAPFYHFQTSKIKREEEKAWRESDYSIAVLEEEAKIIESVSGKQCYVVENGINLDYFKFKERKRKKIKNILFVGNFSYFPNFQAVEFFYNKVFNKINDQNLYFTIVGKHSHNLSFIKDKRVKLIDYVSDIRDMYYNADAFISPVKYGGGTNFKILEAMATGLPIIASPDRIMGLGVEDGKHLLIAENEQDYSDKMLELFNNKELKNNLVKNARILIEEKYSWEKIGKKLNGIWKGSVI